MSATPSGASPDTRLAASVRGLCLALVFLQTIPNVGALRQLALVALLVTLVARIGLEAHAMVSTRLGTGFAPWFWLLGLWALFCSVTGPYPVESLDAMRVGWLPQGLLAAAILLEFTDRRYQHLLLRALVYGFVVTTLLGAGEALMTRGEVFNGGLIAHGAMVKGYANQAAVLMPVTLLLLFEPAAEKMERVLLTVAVLTGILLVIFYSSRTALIALSLGSGACLLLIGRWRRALALAAAAALVGLIAFNMHIVNGEKYRSLLAGQTYVTDTGLSFRLSVWGGALDVIAERPLTGYGYGWKKLPEAIAAGNFVSRWNDARPGAAAFYAPNGKLRGHGGANPHNLILQLLFELGAIGLALYLAVWISWFRTSQLPLLKAARGRVPGPERRLLATGLGVSLAFIAVNASNGYWEGSIANTVLCWLCLGACMAQASPATDAGAGPA